MHPDYTDACFRALMHNLFGDFRAGNDNHALHATWDGFHIGVAGAAIISLDMGIDREHRMTGVFELTINIVGNALRFSGEKA